MATVDASVQEAYEAIRQDSSGVTWMVVGYEGNTKLVLQSKGSGNAEECAAALADDQCQYGCIRVQFVAEDKTTRTKFVTFSWAGPSSSVLRRGKMSVHKSAFKGVCKDACVDLALTGDDVGKEALNDEGLIERIKKVNY